MQTLINNKDYVEMIEQIEPNIYPYLNHVTPEELRILREGYDLLYPTTRKQW